jgi:hypothetical protein
MKRRLHPHEVPNFFETNSQRWAAIFVGVGLFLCLLNTLGYLRDPSPYLQYFTAVGTAFIFGTTGTDAIRTYKSETFSKTVERVNQEDGDKP